MHASQPGPQPESQQVIPTQQLRQEYSDRLPALLQPLVTRFSGKAAPGEVPPRIRVGNLTYVLLTLLQWPAAVAVSTLALVNKPLIGALLLPFTWLISVNALRKAQVVVAHHAVHSEILGTRRANYVIQVLASAEAFVHNWEDYFQDHVRGHHSRKVFTTEVDPDAQLLIELGFTVGMSRELLWRRLLLTIVSPGFHLLIVGARMRTNFVTAPLHRQVVAAFWLAAIATFAVFVPWWVFVLTVVIPLFPLYHVSALLQFLSEHGWLRSSGPPESKADYASRCWGRFCLEPLPSQYLPPTLRLYAWWKWAVRMLLLQAPVRFGVLVGDMPVHDLHHLYPAEHDWVRGLWVRQRVIDSGDEQGLAQREYYCLSGAINAVFIGMSREQR